LVLGGLQVLAAMGPVTPSAAVVALASVAVPFAA
jgi:hypothetical protein